MSSLISRVGQTYRAVYCAALYASLAWLSASAGFLLNILTILAIKIEIVRESS